MQGYFVHRDNAMDGSSSSQGFSSDASRLVGSGFSAVANHIAHKEGISKKSAGAILASASRKASKKAVRANPNLAHVKR